MTGDVDYRGELTPGDVGRAALYDDPVAVAAALALWAGGDRARLDLAAWLERVAVELRRVEPAGDAWPDDEADP